MIFVLRMKTIITADNAEEVIWAALPGDKDNRAGALFA
jgi:hypothetical protein